VAIYLTLDGVEGPISDPVKKAIELHSVQFGIGCALTKQKNLGYKRESEPSLSEITVTKVTDTASTTIIKDICGGAFYKTGEILVTKLINKKPEPFLKFTLEEVFISGWSISSGGDSPTESLSLAFNKIKIGFAAEKDGKLGGFVAAGWNHLKDEVY
jgi:type VI secretion system secreted protein Hcp